MQKGPDIVGVNLTKWPESIVCFIHDTQSPDDQIRKESVFYWCQYFTLSFSSLLFPTCLAFHKDYLLTIQTLTLIVIKMLNLVQCVKNFDPKTTFPKGQ